MPVAAEARRSDNVAIGAYLRARAADSVGHSAMAIENYTVALAAAPGNTTIAFRAYREAVEAGDFALAVRAATSIDRTGTASPDAQLLLYVAALRSRDWGAASARLAKLADAPGLGFLAPMFGRWLSLAAPTPAIAGAGRLNETSANAYTAENNALLALAHGNIADGITAIKGMWTLDPYRAGSLRLAAAAGLAERRERRRALDLIVADDQAARRARTLIENGDKLGLSVTSPTDGVAFLLARVGGDLLVDGSARPALTMARIAQFASPENARIGLLVASALDARKRHNDALVLVDSVVPDAVYGDDAASFRISLLEAAGRSDEAIAAARARTSASANDQARVGDIEMRRRNFGAAAMAYQIALDRAGDKAEWPLIFAAANAYDNAGDWSRAKPLLERAHTSAPEEPSILNELGYGLIINGEGGDRGFALVTRAAALRPDDPAIIDSLGWAHYRRGAFAEAVSLLERAVRLDQRQAEIGEHLGDAYWASGRHVAARYAWTAARIQAERHAQVRLDEKIARKP